MKALEFKNVGFSYPAIEGQPPAKQVLRELSLSLDEGDFGVLYGATGSGKTTLLRLAKNELAPVGERAGEVVLLGREAKELALRESAETVGYVSQNPANQIVCDSVWHELAFGLENLGIPADEMRLRIAETCIYLGMEGLFHARTAELSGGEQALVCLAAALVLRPRILLLDEPASMLDPVAQKEFFSLLERVRRELGMTVLVATHDPGALAGYANRFFELADGKVREHGGASALASRAMPRLAGTPQAAGRSVLLAMDDVWMRYTRDGSWVLRGFDARVGQGEVHALVGANGSGKSTVLELAAGSLRPQRGSVARKARRSAYLPQNPKALLACDSVRSELAEWCPDAARADEALARLGLASEPQRHPLDLSGGQQQLLAFEKILLADPELILLDEPTKGLDAQARLLLAQRVAALANSGAGIVIATHDMGFAAAVAHTVSLLFDGQAQATLPAEEFFEHAWIFSPQGRAL